jgi:hypothetical protein
MPLVEDEVRERLSFARRRVRDLTLAGETLSAAVASRA